MTMYKSWVKLAGSYLDLFKVNPDQFLRTIVEGQSVRGCLTSLYYEFVHRGTCARIEDLPQQEKEELWREASRLIEAVHLLQSPHLPKQIKLDICRALHAFTTYCNLDEQRLGS